VDGCSAHGESGVNTERGVTQGRQQNAGIGEAVTMTTVTGEVLVRIRDHAYVTTPWRQSVDGNGASRRRGTWCTALAGS